MAAGRLVPAVARPPDRCCPRGRSERSQWLPASQPNHLCELNHTSLEAIHYLVNGYAMVQEVGFAKLQALGIKLVAADSPQSFLDDTPTSKLIRQILGAVSEFDKAMVVAKLKGARDRKRALTARRSRAAEAMLSFIPSLSPWLVNCAASDPRVAKDHSGRFRQSLRHAASSTSAGGGSQPRRLTRFSASSCDIPSVSLHVALSFGGRAWK